MPSLEYFVLCESVSTDTETNRISLFNIIEELGRPRPVAGGNPPQGIPVVQMVAVSCWNREPGDEDADWQAMLRIIPTEGDPAEHALNFRMQSRRQRLMMRLVGMPAMPPGDVQFELLLNGEHQAYHTITISDPADLLIRDAQAE